MGTGRTMSAGMHANTLIMMTTCHLPVATTRKKVEMRVVMLQIAMIAILTTTIAGPTANSIGIMMMKAQPAAMMRSTMNKFALTNVTAHGTTTLVGRYAMNAGQ